MLVVWDETGRVHRVNRAAATLNVKVGRVLDPSLRPDRLPRAGETVQHEHVVGAGRDTLRAFAWGTSLLSRKAGRRLFITAGGDVTELRRREVRLHALATTDPLTGLANRPALLEALTEQLSDPNGKGVHVLFCDLDGFKAVNDTYGHAAGDRVLQTVAKRLRRCVRDNDLVGRLGGDEFVVICPRLPEETAATLARRLTTSVSQPIVVTGGAVAVGLSVGVATGDAGDHPAGVLDAADSSMYQVKSWRGTQRVVTAAGAG
jgi:cyclic di-GMP phosphodiesterase Gmr